MNVSPNRGMARRVTLLALLLADAPAAADGEHDPEATRPSPPMVSTPPAELLADAVTRLENMLQAVRRIATLQDVAKRQRDVIKLNCVNDKLSQVKGHVAMADEVLSRLRFSDGVDRSEELTRFNILQHKVLVLSMEAENCVAEDLTYLGGTAGSPSLTCSHCCDAPAKRETAATAAATIRFHDGVTGRLWRLVRLVVALDGAAIYANDDEDKLGALRDIEILKDSNLSPGEHVLAIIVEYRGTGLGIFTYMKGYHPKARAAYRFTAIDRTPLALDVSAARRDQLVFAYRLSGGTGGSQCSLWSSDFSSAAIEE